MAEYVFNVGVTLIVDVDDKEEDGLDVAYQEVHKLAAQEYGLGFARDAWYAEND